MTAHDNTVLKLSIQALAEINATGETELLTEKDIQSRRLIVNTLEKMKVIELEEPRESGKFMFNTEEHQNIYLEAYNHYKNQ